MRSASGAQVGSESERQDERVFVPNVLQLLKSEGRRSTLRLHSLLSGASRLWHKSKSSSSGCKDGAQAPVAVARVLPPPRVLGVSISRQSGWESAKSSRVLLAEPAGFGGSSRQRPELNASWMDPQARFTHLHIRSGASDISPGKYLLPPTFSRRGATPAVFSRTSAPQRAIASQDMVQSLSSFVESEGDMNRVA